MLNSKWNSLLMMNTLVLYVLSLVPDKVLRANHISPFSYYQKHVINKYFKKGMPIPREYLKFFKRNNKALDIITAYYNNQKRNHKLIQNFRRFLQLDLSTKSTDKHVHLYTLEITTKPESYHVYQDSWYEFWIIDGSGQNAFINWSNALKYFQSNKLKRTNINVLGSMIHCKPNLGSMLELHAHINLFSFGPTQLTQKSIADYFTNKLGFPVSTYLRPMHNVLTGKPIVFTNGNCDEPVHLITAHDANYNNYGRRYIPRPNTMGNQKKHIYHSNKQSQNDVGDDYDSVEDEENNSGKDSGPLSVPDPPDDIYQSNNQQEHGDGKELSDNSKAKALCTQVNNEGISEFAIYVLATINSSYNITRRHGFSYKQTGIYKKYKYQLKQMIKSKVVAQILIMQPSINNVNDRYKAKLAWTHYQLRLYMTADLAMSCQHIINDVQSFVINCPDTSSLAQLGLDFNYINEVHKKYVMRLHLKAYRQWINQVEVYVIETALLVELHSKFSNMQEVPLVINNLRTVIGLENTVQRLQICMYRPPP